MAERLVRDESPVVCTPWVNTDLLFNTFISEGQSVSEGPQTVCWQHKTGRSAWYTRGPCCQSRRTLTGWKMGQQELHKIQKVKCKILHLGDNKPTRQYTLGATQLERSFSEKGLGDQIHHDLKEVCIIESSPFQWCPVTGPESVSTNRNTEYFFWTTWNICNCKHDRALENIVQRHCAMLLPVDIQKPFEPGNHFQVALLEQGGLLDQMNCKDLSTFLWFCVSKFIFMWARQDYINVCTNLLL